MPIKFPKTLRTNEKDLSWIASLAFHREVLNTNNDIVLDFSNVRIFEENLCVALGVLVERWRSARRNVNLYSKTSNIDDLRRTNDLFKTNSNFFSNISSMLSWKTDNGMNLINSEVFYKIPYMKFARTDISAQTNYVQRLLNTQWWPKMTDAVRNALADNILEIFNNAEEHSESSYGVFVCGNIGRKEQKFMKISIADAGIGFRQKIEKVLGLKMSSSQAIVWGMQEGNTVRKNNPGGLGLKLLKEFISKNNGRLSIISDKGFWEFSKNKIKTKELVWQFPGTMITIAINTADTKSYRLENEN